MNDVSKEELQQAERVGYALERVYVRGWNEALAAAAKIVREFEEGPHSDENGINHDLSDAIEKLRKE